MRSRSRLIHRFLDRFYEARLAWEEDYRRFARMRGFSSFNDWPYHRRGFIEAWAQPGFHRFWQVWNPGIAYIVHRLYLRLGGRRHWTLPTVASFTTCGMVHTLVVAPFLGHWSNSLVVAFFLFGTLTVFSRRMDRLLRQDRWPMIVNTMVNVGLVLLCFDLGFRADSWARAAF